MTPTLLAEPSFAGPDPALAAELAELRRQVAELRAVADFTERHPHPVLQYSPDGRRRYANPAALALRDGLGPAEQERVGPLLDGIAASRISEQFVQVGERYFEVLVAEDVLPAGSVTLFLVERTTRVLLEKQMTEQQSFLEQILDTTPSLVFVRDAESNFLFENRALRELFAEISQQLAAPTNLPINQVLGREEERQSYANADAQVLLTGEQTTLEDLLTMPNGEQRWYHTVKRRLVRPDGTQHIFGVSTDITAQKTAKQALEEREKMYRDLMTYSQALIYTHDLSGTLLSANPATARLLGLPLERLTGHNLRAVCAPNYRPAIEQYLADLVTAPMQQGVTGVLDRAGQLRYVLYDNHLIAEPGRPPYVIGYAQDITERILAEQQLREAKAAAEAAVTARENFLANMSHEIRTPLNGVLGMAAQLAKTALDARQHEFLQIIRQSGQHLLHVINDVLDIAKITSGKLELEATAFNLCDSMAEAVRPLAMQAIEKGLNFGGTPLRASCAYPWVVGDSHRLNQILINLVSNAIKFTDAGGSITVVGEQVSETPTTLTVRFSVTDTGIGIAPDKQQLIFEGFTQAYADTTRRFGGTGLGLSISKALVAQLGGQLSLASTPGQGSTFAFELTLPKAQASQLPAATDGSADAYDLGELRGRRLLVVEDNEINRTVARMLFEGWGAEVDEAPDGFLGVELVRQQLPYDVILMDIQLPGLSGLEATAAIRALPDAVRANTRIVALTANAFQSDRERYLAAGMDACLAKPFEEELVYSTLVRMLPPALPYDLGRLRTLSRGREEFVQKIIRSFLQNIPASLAQLTTAAQGHDWVEVAKVVHHIKPSLESLGVLQVAGYVEQLEQNPPADPTHLPAALAKLVAQVQLTLDALPRELA